MPHNPDQAGLRLDRFRKNWQQRIVPPLLLFTLASCAVRSSEEVVPIIGPALGGPLDTFPAGETVPAVTTPTSRPKAAPTERLPNEKIREIRPDSLLEALFSPKNLTEQYNARPWLNSTTNIAWHTTLPWGGVTYADRFYDERPWTSKEHLWQDDQGDWHEYEKRGDEYILVKRNGPGVVNRLWFSYDDASQLTDFQKLDPRNYNYMTWGNLDKLGFLKITIDGQVVFNRPITEYFSGKPFGIPDQIGELINWKVPEMGSVGSLLKLSYAKSVEISVYRGEQPRFFAIDGLTFPLTTKVIPFTGRPTDYSKLATPLLSRIIKNPDVYLNTVGQKPESRLLKTNTKDGSIDFPGTGTIEAIQLKVPKHVDQGKLTLRIRYGSETAVSMPLIAFFGEKDRLSFHKSFPLSIIEDGDSILYVGNLPLPFDQGMALEVHHADGQRVDIAAQYVRSNRTVPSRLYVDFGSDEKLLANGPNYVRTVVGSGKVVGMVLTTKDQCQMCVRREYFDNGIEVVFFPHQFGFLEGNVEIDTGKGTLIHSSIEDFFNGGIYWNLFHQGVPNQPYTHHSGLLSGQWDGAKPFGTFYRYFHGTDGIEFTNALKVSMQHGVFNNNWPVTYALTIYYYKDSTPSVQTLPQQPVKVEAPQERRSDNALETRLQQPDLVLTEADLALFTGKRLILTREGQMVTIPKGSYQKVTIVQSAKNSTIRLPEGTLAGISFEVQGPHPNRIIGNKTTLIVPEEHVGVTVTGKGRESGQIYLSGITCISPSYQSNVPKPGVRKHLQKEHDTFHTGQSVRPVYYTTCINVVNRDNIVIDNIHATNMTVGVLLENSESIRVVRSAFSFLDGSGILGIGSQRIVVGGDILLQDGSRVNGRNVFTTIHRDSFANGESAGAVTLISGKGPTGVRGANEWTIVGNVFNGLIDRAIFRDGFYVLGDYYENDGLIVLGNTMEFRDSGIASPFGKNVLFAQNQFFPMGNKVGVQSFPVYVPSVDGVIVGPGNTIDGSPLRYIGRPSGGQHVVTTDPVNFLAPGLVVLEQARGVIIDNNPSRFDRLLPPLIQIPSLVNTK